MVDNRKIHVRGICYTLCGRGAMGIQSRIAKTWAEVNCKRCMTSPEYNAYLTGKFKEKPCHR